MVEPTNDPQAPRRYADRMFTFDHLIPKSRGGTNDLSNLIGCCQRCNRLKAEGDLDFLRVRMMFKKYKWPRFNLEQYEFLLARGINLGRLEKYKFFFEVNNLK